MEKLSEETARALFIDGARSVAEQLGSSSDDSAKFANEVMKLAASGKIYLDDEEDGEEDTWWSRNKHWALPTLVGAGALWLGNDAGKNGREDRNVFQNLGTVWGDRLRALLGVVSDPMYRSMTTTR